MWYRTGMKRLPNGLRSSFFLRTLPLLAFLGQGLPACRSNAEAVCDIKCDCEGCSNAQLDDCYHDTDNKEREADRAGCLDVYDDLKACEYNTAYCKSGSAFATSCKTEKDRYDTCKK